MKGIELNRKDGQVFTSENVTVMHFTLQKNEKIPRHNHPEKIIFFMLVNGHMSITLSEKETHTINSPSVLQFDGENDIEGIAHEPSDVFVFLIKK